VVNVGHFEIDVLIALNAASVPPIYGLPRTPRGAFVRGLGPAGFRVPLI
jgi:hypothetical protein